MKNRARWLLSGLCLAAVAALVMVQSGTAADQAAKAQENDHALKYARQNVKMLDDVYKATVVLITDKYVHSENDFPAGSAAVALFAAVKKKGWHEVRLVDAAGEPIIENNAPRDDFEKEAVKQLKSGKDYYEQVVSADGKRELRAATPIPVVSKKCIMCHPNYADAKEGAPIGVLAYRIPVE
jgi:hypothetical protein